MDESHLEELLKNTELKNAELAEAKQRIRMLRQEIEDKEELITEAELSQKEMEIAKQRAIEEKEEIIRNLRSKLNKARLDQDEIDELRTKGINPKIWPFF